MLFRSRLCLAFAGAILSFSAFASSGEPFTLVQGKNGAISTYGSGSDNEELDRLKRTSNGPFLWFRDHGKSYVIEDRALLARADAAWKPVQALGQEMSALGSQMGEHGRQMGKLGREMGEHGRQSGQLSRADAADLKKLSAQLAEAQRKLASARQAQQIGRASCRERVF